MAAKSKIFKESVSNVPSENDRYRLLQMLCDATNFNSSKNSPQYYRDQMYYENKLASAEEINIKSLNSSQTGEEIICTENIVEIKKDSTIIHRALPSCLDRDLILATQPCPKHKDEDVVRIRIFDKLNNIQYTYKKSRDQFFKGFYIPKDKNTPEITLHCDVPVFNWFHLWLQDQLVVQPNMVIPLLKFAKLLGIDSLIQDCLQCWEKNINLVQFRKDDVDTTAEFVLALANKLNNYDLEDVENAFLQNVLYKHFIIFLNEEEPRNNIGHYETTAHLFECQHCGRILVPGKARRRQCHKVEISINGTVEPSHKKSLDWSLSGFVNGLKGSLGSWRKVYWRLWGICHYVSCSTCKDVFPLNQMNWCRYHPQEKLFKNDSYGYKYFPCCKKFPSPYEVIQSEGGCKLHSHIPDIQTPIEAAVMSIYQLHSDLINESGGEKPIAKFQITHPKTYSSFITKSIFEKRKKRCKDKLKGWSESLAVNRNQDNQRDAEEFLFKRIEYYFTSKCGRENVVAPKPLGGSYVCAEIAWWKAFCELSNADKEKRSKNDKNSVSEKSENT